MWFLAPLFLLVLVGAFFGLVGYGAGAVADGLSGLKERHAALRGLAALSAAGAAALYAWGLLAVLGAVVTAEDGGTDSSPPRSCRTAGWEERAAAGVEITDYRVGFVPLGFVCETSDGGSYDNGDVPGYVNPGLAGFALAAVASAVSAGWISERRARAAAGGGEAADTDTGAGAGAGGEAADTGAGAGAGGRATDTDTGTGAQAADTGTGDGARQEP
ncbi:hypothetical protein ACIRPR_11830 [Streptomyces griseoflavus]|uniref:hypothetical protein n=1 Tax=Streptomyces griseoflavus TaxID=35619 RepID=UPI0038046182